MSQALAVAVHDVEPRTFERCRQIREWLLERGIARVTLLVIPAADLHPVGRRSPTLAAWLRARVAAGDSVAQHGLVHRAAGSAAFPRNLLAAWQGGPAAEFPGLGAADARLRVETGRRLLREIELDPHGFVAPGYAYTRPLVKVLHSSFEWFADLHSVRGPEGVRLRSPALCLGTSTLLKRLVSPVAISLVAGSCGEVMRVDIHPADFALPRHIAVLDALMHRGAQREAVTYDQLLA